MAGVTILFTGILTILLIKVIRDNKVITEENKLILEEIKKLQLPESGQDRNQEDQTLRNTVMIAVAEAMESAVRNSMEAQRGGLDRMGSLPHGGRFIGNAAVSVPTTALVRQAR